MSRPPVPDFRALRIMVRRDLSISAPARIVFEDICDLAEQTGECVAGDAHFQEAYKAKPRTVRNWITELREAGYLTSKGATNKRRLVPTAPQLRPPGGLKLRQATGLSDPNLGQSGVTNLGQSGVRSIEYSSSEREESSAREDSRPEYPRPTLADVLTRAAMSGVPEAEARAFWLHYEAAEWMTSGQHPQPIRNWVPKLMQWHGNQSAFAPRGKVAAAPPTGSMRSLADEL